MASCSFQPQFASATMTSWSTWTTLTLMDDVTIDYLQERLITYRTSTHHPGCLAVHDQRSHVGHEESAQYPRAARETIHDSRYNLVQFSVRMLEKDLATLFGFHFPDGVEPEFRFFVRPGHLHCHRSTRFLSLEQRVERFQQCRFYPRGFLR